MTRPDISGAEASVHRRGKGRGDLPFLERNGVSRSIVVSGIVIGRRVRVVSM